jgi:precorrin-2 methylase
MNFAAANNDYHARKIKAHLDEGKKVLVVAHSQGTLYANTAYNLLTSAQKQSVSLAFVAGAASYMADGSSNWVLNPLDYVINNLLTAMSYSALPSNLPAKKY